MRHDGGEAERDLDYLKVVAAFHYLVGGFVLALALLLTIFIVVTFTMVAEDAFALPHHREFPLVLMSLIWGCFLLAAWFFGIATVASGRAMLRLRHREYSIVIAGIYCTLFPLGTIFGAFTIFVLLRDSVRRLYQSQRADDEPSSLDDEW
ncbi:hypothetical protein Pan216_54870 [Planctomycetes bacterium Pan216]|uniref:Uncharacterized protein n=1 Tax=Kolteria novifilia TaxID=2527975 RepID=A0A518BCB6_9BACT|nr:hypothetical protein Pan216_54870 [Planctomycetes bacterium Pan216]